MPRSLNYPDVPAWWILKRSVDSFPDRIAVVFLDFETLQEVERLSYGELWRRACGVAAGLRRAGVGRGQTIAVFLPNSPALIASYYGIWLTGAAITPCNLMASDKDLDYQLRDSGASLLIADRSKRGMAAEAAEKMGIRLIYASTSGEEYGGDEDCLETMMDAGQVEEPDASGANPSEDMAVLLYTGGTTGEPKGAILTHRNIVANTMQFAGWYGFKPGDETCVCTIPMSHSGGMSGVMNVPLYSGATLVVMKRFKAESVALAIEKFGATRFFGVPTMYVAILNSEKACRCDLSTLRACRTNAAPLPVAVKRAFDAIIGREVLVEGYGLTETSPLTHANPIGWAREGSIGIPLPDTDAKVVDLSTGEEVAQGGEGELLIKGPQVMKGYWNKPEATEKALSGGWFRTGDVVRTDEEGYFYIVDRLKDMINTGGYKVWPREVEEALYSHPKLSMAAVVGVPDGYYGELVKAIVVPKKDFADDISAEEIKEFCKQRMATYKVPRKVEIRDGLPISPQGKVLRRLVREEERRLAGEAGDEGCGICGKGG